MRVTREEWICSIAEIGALKFGEFVLKSGETSPFYIDLRLLLTHPDLLRETANLLADKIAAECAEYDLIVGIPYAAMPIATALALQVNRPLVCLRKESKGYGSGGMLVGEANPGERCLIIDDLVTSGLSKIETVRALEAEGLVAEDVVVLIDRSNNATEELQREGLRLRALVTLREMVAVLQKAGYVTPASAQEIVSYLDGQPPRFAANDAAEVDSAGAKARADRVTSSDRVASVLADKMREVMRQRESNLILSLDVTTQEEFFSILSETASSIAMLKTHVDVLSDFGPSFPRKLREIADREGFLILEDRKFADIGNTVRHQYRGGPFKISTWADFVTVHMISGEAILDGLFDGLHSRGAFLLARMSSKGNLISDEYTEQVVEIGRRRGECVAGYIGHGANGEDVAEFRERLPRDQLLLVPGVKLEPGSDALGQQYLSVEDAIAGGADAIIVGRGIYGQAEPGAAAEEYRQKAWSQRIEREV